MRHERDCEHRFPAPRLGAAVWLSAALLAAGCAMAPTPEEIARDETRSAYEQSLRMAESIRRNGDPQGSITFFKRAHNLAPQKLEPLAGLAGAAAQAGALEEATQACDKAVLLASNDAELRSGCARVSLSRNRPDLAAGHLRAAIELRPSDARLRNALGVALDLAGDPSGAQNAYREGLRLAPNDFALTNNLALSLALSGDVAESLALLDHLALSAENGRRIRQNLALVYVLADREKEASEIARSDLPRAQVETNLEYYRSIKRMNATGRASALFARRSGGGG